MSERPSLLRSIGSMWFAAVLLMVLLVAMACATVFEKEHSTERALFVFYRSPWFVALLALLCVNVFAAMVVRYPFSKRQIGFLITHVSILVLFAGALLTRELGLDGRVGFAEGKSVSEFTLPDEPSLMVVRRGATEVKSSIALERDVFTGFERVDDPDAPVLRLDDLSVEILRYLPDSRQSRELVNDNPRPSSALEVSLSHAEHLHPSWIFANQATQLGEMSAMYRVVPSEAALLRALDRLAGDGGQSKGVVRIMLDGRPYGFPMEQLTGEAVRLGATEYSVRVLRYLPHATVGGDGSIVSASNRPDNPFIEAEIVGPNGTEIRRAFSAFPDYGLRHGATESANLKVRFIANENAGSGTSVEIIGEPSGKMFARFTVSGQVTVSEPLRLGEPAPTPWHDQVLTVLRRFDNARFSSVIAPVEEERQARQPAVLVKLTAGEHENEMWLQKHRGYPVTVVGVAHELVFSDRVVPLGFDLRLDKFRVGMYPGTSRPRTFQSNVTVIDPARDLEEDRVISMNSPTTYGGYTFYQSSYDQREGGETRSFLSVSRDPGQPVVFAGYFAMMGGMVWVLVLRMRDRRRFSGSPAMSSGAR
jgi:hypothetical protein